MISNSCLSLGAMCSSHAFDSPLLQHFLYPGLQWFKSYLCHLFAHWGFPNIDKFLNGRDGCLILPFCHRAALTSELVWYVVGSAVYEGYVNPFDCLSFLLLPSVIQWYIFYWRKLCILLSNLNKSIQINLASHPFILQYQMESCWIFPLQM